MDELQNLDISTNPCDIIIAKIIRYSLELKLNSLSNLLIKTGFIMVKGLFLFLMPEYLNILINDAKNEADKLQELADMHRKRCQCIIKEF
ncbi:hypothetical protein HZS_6143 [Henneguya salminicola]|nr:hypothetical protein HZS_6143 [Henneguya salminicola]